MIDKIKTLIENKDFYHLKFLLEQSNEADISEWFNMLDDDETVLVFRLLHKDVASEVFSYLESGVQEHLINILSEKEIKNIVSNLFIDDAVDLIEEMPANLVDKILRNVSKERRKEVNELLNYPTDSAGSIMTTDYFTCNINDSVEHVLRNIKKQGTKKEALYIIYVLDGYRHLVGVLEIKELLLAEFDEKIKDIYEENVISCTTITDQEEVVGMFDKYDLLALPVVDNEKRLVGIVTVDDALEVLNEETEEDFEIMAGINPSDEDYLKQSIFTHYRKRILWLLILMFSATFTGIITANYEDSFKAVPMLVSFIPMIMGTGGNCGSQSSVVIIRGLSNGELKTNDFIKALLKEFCIALLVGLTLGLVNGLRIYLMYQDLLMSITIFFTLTLVPILAKVMGVILPFLAKKIGLDPAYMASPLLTTILDCVSLIIFFNIAIAVLGI